MDKNQFLEYLAIYGADLGCWPKELGEEAERAVSASAELRRALDEERRFEEALDERSFEEASPGLERRIINAAGEAPERGRNSILDLLGSIFSGFPFPRPAIVLPLLLVLGIAAGYLYTNYDEQESQGAQLAEILYYEEGYYE